MESQNQKLWNKMTCIKATFPKINKTIKTIIIKMKSKTVLGNKKKNKKKR